MKTVVNPPFEQWPALAQRPQIELEFLDSAVKNIINRVKNSGDAALREFSRQFDKVDVGLLNVSEGEIEKSEQLLSPTIKEAIRAAASNIEKFHAAQRRTVEIIETMPGVTCWRKAVAISKVGVYIPGGSAPLFSTVLMLGIPARLAGCEEIVLCTPPTKKGDVNPAILFAARVAGIKKVFKVGGAQAIAAMAYGTETVPRVDKIFGPGNQYVTKAKQLVNQEGVAIDMPAGPSEVLIIADEKANPKYVASDLLAQAEHGADSQVVLVSSNESTIDSVKKEIEIQLASLPRKQIAQAALDNSRFIVFRNGKQRVDFVNFYSPEHLIINAVDAEDVANKITNAGSVFLGEYTPESAGDYASGTNHTLPTNGFAKTSGGVSLESFLKYITFQKITADGLRKLGPIVETMAEAEHLNGHKNSVSLRLKDLQ